MSVVFEVVRLNPLLACERMSKSIHHCLWDCDHARQVWLRILRILQKQNVIVDISWGSIVWSTLQPQVVRYDSSIGLTRMISISVRKVYCIPINLKGPNVTNDKVNELWDILSACSTWHVSKARSSWLFQGMIYRPSQIIQTIWNELMFTVKARYDNIKGSSDAVMMKRLALYE